MIRLLAFAAAATALLAVLALTATGPLRTAALLLLIIDGAIVIHELAHLLTARLFGVRATEFGVGFGPALLAHEVGGTRWTLRLLPVGGYVALDGENDGPFSRLPFAKRALVMAAGPLSNIAAAWAILAVMVGASTGGWAQAPGAAAEIATLILGSTASAVGAWVGSGNALDVPFVGLPGIAASVDLVATRGVEMLAVLAAALQLSVGIFNLLPIPPTDGGKIALDLLFGRSWAAPIWRERAERVGLAFFILLGIGVTLLDFVRIGSGYFERLG